MGTTGAGLKAAAAADDDNEDDDEEEEAALKRDLQARQVANQLSEKTVDTGALVATVEQVGCCIYSKDV